MPFGIGVEHPKAGVNIGTLLRSAELFGASFVFTVGRRYKRQASDTLKSYKQLPVFHYLDWADYRNHCPHDWLPVAVELLRAARPLPSFAHPTRCVYLLGPEDGTLSKAALAMAAQTVRIPMALSNCLNVATAGSIVMYDRFTKGVENMAAQLYQDVRNLRHEIGPVPFKVNELLRDVRNET